MEVKEQVVNLSMIRSEEELKRDLPIVNEDGQPVDRLVDNNCDLKNPHAELLKLVKQYLTVQEKKIESKDDERTDPVTMEELKNHLLESHSIVLPAVDAIFFAPAKAALKAPAPTPHKPPLFPVAESPATFSVDSEDSSVARANNDAVKSPPPGPTPYKAPPVAGKQDSPTSSIGSDDWSLVLAKMKLAEALDAKKITEERFAEADHAKKLLDSQVAAFQTEAKERIAIMDKDRAIMDKDRAIMDKDAETNYINATTIQANHETWSSALAKDTDASLELNTAIHNVKKLKKQREFHRPMM